MEAKGKKHLETQNEVDNSEKAELDNVNELNESAPVIPEGEDESIEKELVVEVSAEEASTETMEEDEAPEISEALDETVKEAEVEELVSEVEITQTETDETPA
ncbi:MAG: hypothetical protein JXR22_07300, partial [Prolixibacteraceae bacterium]|nr:hypothetical protein [Prolixibacteraceae bacterium]